MVDWVEKDWKNLIESIEVDQCTPFIGSGACYGVLPTGKSMAEEWAKAIRYPFKDFDNLIRVAQYVAVEEGDNVPRNRIVARFKKAGYPDFGNPAEPHRVLADLKCPIYITTNYDDFMYRALIARATARGEKNFKPTREHCRWYEPITQDTKARLAQDPSAQEPLVYHLHGVLDPPSSIASMVVTEDDYVDFLAAYSDPRMIPEQVKSALSNTSLLFIGYSLEDMNFKVILRRVTTYMKRAAGARHVSVQLAPKAEGEPPTKEEVESAERQRDYLTKHYGLQRVTLCWATAEEFCKELGERWAKPHD